MATVNILKDCTVTITAGGADDGAYTGGSSDTIKCDEVRFSFERQTEDHSTGQDEVAQHRTRKEDFEIEISTKLEDATALGILQGNELFTVAVTAGTGFNVSCVCICTSLEQNYAGPSTLRATFRAYGTAPSYS